MVKKIRKVGAFLIFLILVVSVGATAYVHSTTVEDVKKVAVEIQDGNNALVSWKSSKNFDGYKLYYCKNVDGEQWQEIDIDDKNAKSYVIEGLDYVTDYKFCILGIKNIANQVYQSEEYKELNLFVPPKKQEIKSCKSYDKGAMAVSWTVDELCNGYELEYSTNEDFKNYETINIDDFNTDKYTVTDLEVGSQYYTRVKSFVLINDEKVYGQYSEPTNATITDKIFMKYEIDPNKPVVALTFDDGPSYVGVTSSVLDLIEYYGIRATFFMVGQNAKGNPNLLNRMVELGCELGNHTYSHERYGKHVTPEDISSCSSAIFDATGQYPTAFRSTGGITNDTIRSECYNENMPLYYWTVDTLDWKTRNPNMIYDAVINNVKDGDIVLMHDIYPTTLQAVEWIIPELINQGYQLVTVSELVTIKTGAPPTPGEQYLSATEIKNNT